MLIVAAELASRFGLQCTPDALQCARTHPADRVATPDLDSSARIEPSATCENAWLLVPKMLAQPLRHNEPRRPPPRHYHVFECLAELINFFLFLSYLTLFNLLIFLLVVLQFGHNFLFPVLDKAYLLLEALDTLKLFLIDFQVFLHELIDLLLKLLYLLGFRHAFGSALLKLSCEVISA